MSEERFEFFWQSDSPFSQWHMAGFVLNGVRFNCAEQAMMHVRPQTSSPPPPPPSVAGLPTLQPACVWAQT